MTKTTTIHIDKNVGLSSLKTYWMRSKCGKFHWCRKAISLFGLPNVSLKTLFSGSPFDPKFNVSYVEGKGRTKEDALKAMQKAEDELCEFMWI